MSDQDTRPFSGYLLQSLKALLIGSAFFIILLFVVISSFHIAFQNRIFPGIHIQGYPVGGMSIEEAAVNLSQHFSLVHGDEMIVLSYFDQKYSTQPAEIGLSVDAVRTALAAYQFGRGPKVLDWIWQQPFIFSSKIEMAPVVVFDQNTAANTLQNIALREDVEKQEATLYLEGTQVLAMPGLVGRTLDLDASITQITNATAGFELDLIDLIVSVEVPELLDASPFIPDAQSILDQPFIIQLPEEYSAGTGRWTITPENLAPMLTFTSESGAPGTLRPQFSQSTLDGLLQSIAEQVNTAPKNPLFIFNDESYELDLINAGISGISVDRMASFNAIQDSVARGNHAAVLVVSLDEPAVKDTATGKELGIIELVHLESSYFYGSDRDRIQNIETAANEFLGLLVAPGETFSMASAMGDITLDNGYAEALIIFDGKTIEGVGGGVCQVSTTLFRTAFFAGFPINERHPHAYRVSYYEKVAGNNRDSNLAGLDATVYIPLVDLKFTNDTPNWLLMEAYVNRAASQITWKFYSSDDGRSVEWQTTGLTNKVEPKKPLYILDEDLESGEIKQVDWEAEGADVTVHRVVYRAGAILLEDTFFTRYAPWRAVYEYGPGTDGIPAQTSD